MIRKGSNTERSLAKALRERFPEAIVIRSAGSLLVDLVLITSKQTVLVEVKNTQEETFRFTKNRSLLMQFKEAKSYSEKGFKVYYAFWHSAKWFFHQVSGSSLGPLRLLTDCISINEFVEQI